MIDLPDRRVLRFSDCFSDDALYPRHDSTRPTLPNRRLPKDHLDPARQRGYKTAVIFINLDRFKHIDDFLENETDDHFLSAATLRLMETVRATDTITRIDRDDFVVFLDQIADKSSVTVFSEKLLSALMRPIRVGSRALHALASIGISVSPDDGTNQQTLIRCAATAMRNAKKCGGNQIQLYAGEMNLATARHIEIEQNLNDRPEQNRLQLYYQPQIDLRQGKVCGMKALIHLAASRQGTTHPEKLTSIAEASGPILPLGDWAIRTACRQVSAWEQAGWPVFPVAINLSARQFFKKNLVKSVRDALDDAGLPAERLEIEVAESTLMQNIDETWIKLRALADMGVQLALSDFAAGCSSLSHLKRLPVNKLKIGQSFISDLRENSNDTVIISAIVSLARVLGLKTQAEGIETVDQVQALIATGCDFGQGSYFAQPLPGEQTSALFEPKSLTTHPILAALAARAESRTTHAQYPGEQACPSSIQTAPHN